MAQLRNAPVKCAVVRLLVISPPRAPMRKKFRGVQNHFNRVMGYRVCQLILSHDNILIIGECPNSLDLRLPKLNSSNACKKIVQLTS